jgi:hypothetical protein
MSRAVAVRRDCTSGKVRRLVKQAKDVAQGTDRWIAAVLDGASQTEAAKIGGIDRQTLRDLYDLDGLINIHRRAFRRNRAFLHGPDDKRPVRGIELGRSIAWCGSACDLILQLYKEFRISVSDDAICRALKTWV